MRRTEPLTRIDRFDIERTLGEGGMGVVYLAYDAEQKRRVALKTLARFDPGSRYRFKKEFRALADVSHPNLVVLHELIASGDTWFFTMEYVDGVDFLAHVCDLRVIERLGSSPTEPMEPRASNAASDGRSVPPTLERSPIVDEQRLRGTLRQLAEGISALHAAGKLHRDIKPSNVMVAHDGRVVLLDFGMIDDTRERTDVTLDEPMFGTPAYMSSEQAAGESATEASDWYSFGVVLYEVLTGRLPIDGSMLDILLRKQREDPPPPSALSTGVPPDLEELCLRLLSRTPSERPTGAEVLAHLREGRVSGVPAAAAIDGLHQSSGFVGRQRELQQLHRAFEATRQGKPSVVLLGGRSGMGKSALVRRFCEDMKRLDNAVVLSGRCYERESLPFKAIDSVIDALCRHIARLPDTAAAQLLPRNVRALARLFPVLRQIRMVENVRFRTHEVPDPQELRKRGIAALKELLARMSDLGPVIVTIDDAHWGDEDSALLLDHLLRAPEAPALLVLCCHRPDVRTSPVLAQLRRLDPAVAFTDMELGPLPETDAAQLAEEELASLGGAAEQDAWRIAAEAEGSPFFIGQLVQSWKRALHATPPTVPSRLSLEDMLQGRIAQLAPSARRLLEVVAVAGRPIERGVALAAADGGERNLAELDGLRAGHFVGTHGPRGRDMLECHHDRVRRAVLAQIASDALASVHLRLGEALEGCTRFEADAVANHYFLAGSPERATPHALKAAADAADALAFDRAALLYERVLESGVVEQRQRAGILERCAVVLAYAGRSAAAAQRYHQAAALSEPASAFEYERMAAEHYLRSGHVEDGMAVLTRVLSQISLGMPKTPTRALMSLLWGRARLSMRGLGYVERAPSAVPPELLKRIDTCWSASIGLGLIDFVRGGDLQTRHCLLALQAGEPYRLSRALAIEAGYLAAEGGKAERRVHAVLEVADRILESHEHPHALGLTKLARAMTALHLGNFRECLTSCAEAERIFRERCKGVAWEVATTRIFEATALYYLGELKLLSERAPEYLREAVERGDFYAASDLHTGVHVMPLLTADDIPGARALVSEEKLRWSQDGFHLQHWNQLLGDALIDLYSGAGREAYERVRSRWPALRRSLVLQVQLIHIESQVLRASAALAASARTPSGDASAIEEARASARRVARLDRPWANPLADLMLGLCDKQERKDEGAVRHLRAAAESFMQADMVLHACAANWHMGVLIGGDEGRVLVSSARSSLVERGVKRPESVVEMLAPGLV